MARPYIIQADGIIGAGKTYLIENILSKNFCGSRVIKEPVGDWGDLLEVYYQDKKRWAYHFQTTAFCSRMKEIKKMWDNHKDRTSVFISERGPESDKMFMNLLRKNGYVTDIEFKDYYTWCNTW